ncbi:hypothetical protein ACFC26_07750 [Kitasatospora purpeofusca]|uniref:hypothetical protein n=1 Tax=Kitasatospora purpeofusca TaxID=67352 RepID=UPI0035DFA4E1
MKTTAHVRIVNGAAPQVVSTSEALAEINDAMMEGKRNVREMSASKSSANIHYRDGRQVTLRPATTDEINEFATSQDVQDEEIIRSLSPRMRTIVAGAVVRQEFFDGHYAMNIKHGGGTDGALLRRGLIELREGAHTPGRTYYVTETAVRICRKLAAGK